MYIVSLPHVGVCLKTIVETWLESACWGYDGEARVEFIAGMIRYHSGSVDFEFRGDEEMLDWIRCVVDLLDQTGIPESERLFLDPILYHRDRGIVCLIPRGFVLGGVPELN